MIKEAIGFGNTIDEAKENAIAKLNVSELEDIQIDLIAMPKKKVLGLFGGSQAQVKAYIEIADKKQKTNNKKLQSKKEKAQNSQPKPQKEALVKEKAEERIQKEQPQYSEAVDYTEIPSDSPAGKAVDYIKSILTAVGCNEVSIKVQNRENASLIHLEGEDLNIIIGRRGETLDAVQYLANLAANNGCGHHKISLNIGNYRERREETLIALAKRISAQVLKTGKNRSLEPMNPYERRIIHTAVQGIDGVVSNSFGEGNNRRVVISVEGSEVRPPRFNDRRKSSNRSRKARPSNKVEVAPTREPKRDSDIPLYGKIN